MRIFFLAAFAFLQSVGFCQTFTLVIGTYTGTGSKGIYVYRFDAETGKAVFVKSTDSGSNHSFLALSPDGTRLYAVNEDASPQGGRVSAYAFSADSGNLTLLNQQPTGGNHPCYLSYDKKRRRIVVGNYSGGNVAVFPLEKDGRLRPYTQLIQHRGSGADSNRQATPHVHATVFSPDGQHLFVPDLGTDKVMIYSNTASANKPLQPAPQAFVGSQPGSGPRHFTFHPSGKWAYLIEELSGSVVAYEYKSGKLKFRQRVLTRPASQPGPFGSADIHLSPDGKFLYASNRAAVNNIAVFKVNPANGTLTAVDYTPVLGLHPRNFCIDPTGNYLLVANRDSDAVVIFKRDSKSGRLADTGERIELPKPVCLKMIAAY